MAAVLEYKGGILSLREGSRRYFDIDLDGRVDLYEVWDVVETAVDRENIAKFFFDFLGSRKMISVKSGKVDMFSKPSGYKLYNFAVVYDDCAVYVAFNGKYDNLLLAHKNFYMIFDAKTGFEFKLIKQKDDCMVIDRERFSRDYLEKLVLGFSNEKIDINAKARFKLYNDILEVYVNNYPIFNLGFGTVDYLWIKFIYYNVSYVDGVDDFYMFLLRTWENNIDKFEYTREYDKHVFTTGDFVVKYDADKRLADFRFAYKHEDFKYIEIGAEVMVGNSAFVVAKLNDGGALTCMFKNGLNLFKSLMQSNDRIRKYIRDSRF